MKRYITAFVVIAILCGITGWRLMNYYGKAAALQKMAAARKNAPLLVTTAPVVERDIYDNYTGVASVESPFNINIASQIVGQIQTLQVRQGSYVTKGQVLVRIDPSQMQAQLNQAQANLAQAQYRLSQAEITTNPTTVSVASQIAVQQAALSSARALNKQTIANYQQQVEAARAALADAKTKVTTAQAAIGAAKAAINAAEANLANSTLTLDRTVTLFKQGFVAAQDVDNARAQQQVYAASVTTAKSQLASATAQMVSARSQVDSANNALTIAVNKGRSDIAASTAAVQQAKASLRLAQANRAQNPAYQANLAALKSAVKAASAQVQTASAQLGYTTLRSPINGWVTARNADPGTMATIGQTLLTIVELKSLYVTVPVPEEDLKVVSLGQRVSGALDALPGTLLSGTVTHINPAADPLSRQFTVRITIANPTNQIKPGMFGHVTFRKLIKSGALEIPREGVMNEKTGTFAAVISNHSTTMLVPIVTGTQDGANVQIMNGLKLGQQVVTLAERPPTTGTKVKIANPQDMSAAASGQ